MSRRQQLWDRNNSRKQLSRLWPCDRSKVEMKSKNQWAISDMQWWEETPSQRGPRSFAVAELTAGRAKYFLHRWGVESREGWVLIWDTDRIPLWWWGYVCGPSASPGIWSCHTLLGSCSLKTCISALINWTWHLRQLLRQPCVREEGWFPYERDCVCLAYDITMTLLSWTQRYEPQLIRQH